MFAWLSDFKTARWSGLGALALLLTALPLAAQQRPSGAEVWAANCGRCHRMRAVDTYTARQWETVVTHMALAARLTPDETEAVREFLVGAARARETADGARSPRQRPVVLASAGGSAYGLDFGTCCDPAVGEAIYKAQCAACHGVRGKGDGPAAVALNPRPSDLTDPARMAGLSVDSLAQVITQGRGSMPGFGKILTPAQVREVAAFVQGLVPKR